VGTVTFAVTRHRLEGYREAAADAGMPWDDVVVAVCSVNDADEAYEQARALLAGPARPDAIAAMSDQLAVGVMRALQEAGLSAPGDVAVTGWDDQPVAAELGLTTVAQSLREQGAMCARAALGEEIPSEGAPWSLVRRRSTRSS
jgi:DNA-binding LacI/PurR family transcriptional regulator